MSCFSDCNLSDSACEADGLVLGLAHLSDSGDGVLDLRGGGASVFLHCFLQVVECLL